VNGTVKTVQPFGAFVDIGADVNCMLHKTQIVDGPFVADARQYLDVGNEVTVRIRSKDEAKGRLEVTMLPEKEVLMPLQRGLTLADLQQDQVLGGRVTSVKQFGVFVDVGAESDGLVFRRTVNDGIVTDMEALLKFGDPVVVKVVGFSEGKLQLLITSPLSRLPPVDGFVKDDWVEGKVTGTVNFGAFVAVSPPSGGDEVTALLSSSQMRENERFRVGDSVKARVKDVDTEKKQVFLSMRPHMVAAEPSEPSEPAPASPATAASSRVTAAALAEAAAQM